MKDVFMGVTLLTSLASANSLTDIDRKKLEPLESFTCDTSSYGKFDKKSFVVDVTPAGDYVRDENGQYHRRTPSKNETIKLQLDGTNHEGEYTIKIEEVLGHVGADANWKDPVTGNLFKRYKMSMTLDNYPRNYNYMPHYVITESSAKLIKLGFGSGKHWASITCSRNYKYNADDTNITRDDLRAFFGEHGSERITLD